MSNWISGIIFWKVWNFFPYLSTWISSFEGICIGSDHTQIMSSTNNIIPDYTSVNEMFCSSNILLRREPSFAGSGDSLTSRNSCTKYSGSIPNGRLKNIYIYIIYTYDMSQSMIWQNISWAGQFFFHEPEASENKAWEWNILPYHTLTSVVSGWFYPKYLHYCSLY